MWAPGSALASSPAGLGASASACVLTTRFAMGTRLSRWSRPCLWTRKERVSMLEPVTLARRSAFAGLLQPLNPGQQAGVLGSERSDLEVATVIARRGFVAGDVKSRYGLDLPAGPKRVASDRMA